jgi:hypothetical protein
MSDHHTPQCPGQCTSGLAVLKSDVDELKKRRSSCEANDVELGKQSVRISAVEAALRSNFEKDEKRDDQIRELQNNKINLTRVITIVAALASIVSPYLGKFLAVLLKML